MHLMARKFLVIFGAEEADRRLPFNDDKPKRAKIRRHKALRVRLSVACLMLPKPDSIAAFETEVCAKSFMA